ncbi:hypothetical protein FHG87_001806 [Trinorchestia longiramus]|nr:hypothetical protein FHG87_001806 [Trinorchestia longiramus]
MENNINSTKKHTTQISNEHNPQQTQSQTQPAGILEPIRELNKIININLRIFDGNKRTTNEKLRTRTATEHHISRKRIRPTNNPPWFSQEIKRLINARQHSYRRLKQYQTEPHRQEHIHACRAVKRTIKSTKRNKEITVAAQAKTNPKSFHKYVNDRRLKKDTIGPLMDSEHSTQTNNKSKAKILNTYSTSVFIHEDLTEIPQPHALNPQKILSDGVFTVQEVEEQLSILNPYKSTGPNGLGTRILKETVEVISKPLTNIFNRSLETGIVPDDESGQMSLLFSKRGRNKYLITIVQSI